MVNINRTYNFIGIVAVEGELKVSFRADSMRKIKSMDRGVRADFVALPEPMTKVDALNYAISNNVFTGPDDQVVLAENLKYQNVVVQRQTGPKRPRGRPVGSGKKASVTVRGDSDSVVAMSDVTVSEVLRLLREPIAE